MLPSTSLAGGVSARRLQRSQDRSFQHARALSTHPESPPADGITPRDVAQLSSELEAIKQQKAVVDQEKLELENEVARLRGLIESCIKAVPASAAHLQMKPSPVVELSPEEKAEKDRVQALVDGERARGECSFFFVSADWVLEQTGTTLPKFQDLRWIDGALVQNTLQASKAYRSEYAQGELLAVSHRWEKPSEPDTEGKQLECIRAHLQANRHIKFVWYDYWCMPQGDRSPADLVHFVWMLKNVNLLYLGCSVLILLDISYYRASGLKWRRGFPCSSAALKASDRLPRACGDAASSICTQRPARHAPI